MKLPTKQECIKLWNEFSLPENIRDHILLVTRLSLFLAKKLKKQGIQININLLEKAALLHDLDKMQTVGRDIEDHGLVSSEILLKKGYSKELAELVRRHRMDIENKPSNSWELKVLRYADARSLGDRIVSIEERFGYVKKRYPHMRKKKYNYIVPLLKKLEKEICNKINIKPEELKKIEKDSI